MEDETIGLGPDGAWYYGKDGRIFRTEDFGQTWQEVVAYTTTTNGANAGPYYVTPDMRDPSGWRRDVRPRFMREADEAAEGAWGQ